MASTVTGDKAAEAESAATAAEVQAQLEKLSQDIAQLTQAVAAFGNAKVREAGDRAALLGVDVAARSSQAFEATKSSLAAMESDLEAQIRNRPLQAIGIAAGVGFLAALLTRR